MRKIEQLVHSRTRVRARHALMPLEGFPISRLPSCPAAEVRVLASPALGAQFVQMLVDLPPRENFSVQEEAGVETFYFVVSGKGSAKDSATHALSGGSFGLVPPGVSVQFAAEDSLRLLILHKCYEPAAGVEMFNAMYGNESHVKKEIWAENPHSLLQTLIPDEMKFDLAMNIFTFDPGHGLPIVETHVMEHGLLFLSGKGLYFLEDSWIEVEKDDFIWMGPYCPQSFYATGPTASRYIYYKNVNRRVPV